MMKSIVKTKRKVEKNQKTHFQVFAAGLQAGSIYKSSLRLFSSAVLHSV